MTTGGKWHTPDPRTTTRDLRTKKSTAKRSRANVWTLKSELEYNFGNRKASFFFRNKPGKFINNKSFQRAQGKMVTSYPHCYSLDAANAQRFPLHERTTTMMMLPPFHLTSEPWAQPNAHLSLPLQSGYQCQVGHPINFCDRRSPIFISNPPH